MRYQKRTESRWGSSSIWEELHSGRLIEVSNFDDGRKWYLPISEIPSDSVFISNGVIGEWDRIPDTGIMYSPSTPPFVSGIGYWDLCWDRPLA